jgi:hypothetical protein
MKSNSFSGDQGQRFGVATTNGSSILQSISEEKNTQRGNHIHDFDDKFYHKSSKRICSEKEMEEAREAIILENQIMGAMNSPQNDSILRNSKKKI